MKIYIYTFLLCLLVHFLSCKLTITKDFHSKFDEPQQEQPQTEPALAPEPINLGSQVVSEFEINLQWESGGENTTGFTLAYTQGSEAPSHCSEGVRISRDKIQGTTYKVSFLKPNTQYSFRVCSLNNANPPKTSKGVTTTSLTNIGVEPAPINSSYCTVWTRFRRYDAQDSAMTFVCLQPDGSWKVTGNEIDSAANCTFVVGGYQANPCYGYPHLFNGENGKVYIGIERCPGYNEDSMVIKEFDKTTGDWMQISSTHINTVPGITYMPKQVQFGASFAYYNNNYYSFWAGSGKSYVSKLLLGAWSHMELDENITERGQFRHPEITQIASRLFLYFGYPKPTVYEIVSGLPTLKGYVEIDSEYTLYTSLAMFDNNLAMAYSSENYPNSWQNTYSKTKVAFHDGSQWNVDQNPITDTPGHDATKPYLFVINGVLYVMYADYTTSGVPVSSGSVYPRLRVKKWNGAEWIAFGTESDQVISSQRLEYTLDNDKVLLSVLAPGSTGLQLKVLGWQNGYFMQVGDTVVDYSALTLDEDRRNIATSRPGAVVVLQ